MRDETGFTGCIRIQPALNDAEIEFLLDLVDSDGTLRGTPTGRGDRDVPFARLAWVVCLEGCCLSWDPALEESTMMPDSLRFLVDHLLRPGAKAEGHAKFSGFTFDHVLDGAVLGRAHHGSGEAWLVEVTDNVVAGRGVPRACDDPQPGRTHSQRRAAKRLPANVIELRPRRA